MAKVKRHGGMPPNNLILKYAKDTKEGERAVEETAILAETWHLNATGDIKPFG